MWKRESQDRVETVESEKGKMSNEQGERVTNNQFTKRKKERQAGHEMSTKHPDVTQRHKGKEEPGLGEQRQGTDHSHEQKRK